MPGPPYLETLCDILFRVSYDLFPYLEIFQNFLSIDISSKYAHMLTMRGNWKSSSSLSTGGKVNLTRALKLLS